MAYLAGIDLGSTSLKAVIYDLDGRAVAQASRPTELNHPDPHHPDWAVWRPEQIWGGVCESLREAIARLPRPEEIRGMAVTGMGMDGVPVDTQGRCLYPFISWHCPRTVPQQQWWLQHIGAERQFAISGNSIWPSNPALRILWLREHEPALLARTDRWLLIEDYVNFMLSGERVTDYSMASNTLLFDQARRTYSDELLQRSGIDRRLLPDPHPSGTVIGAVHRAAAAATGLRPGTPVVLGGHDFLCGALPVGGFNPGVVLNVVGTWEMVVTALARPVLTAEAGRTGWWIDSHVARDRYAAIGCVVAADMLEWFRRELGGAGRRDGPCDPPAGGRGAAEWDQLMALARETPPGADGVLFLPHMSGSTIPVVDAASMGAFVGLRNIVGKGHLVRAMVEGLSCQFLQIIAGLQTALQVHPDRYVAVGGGAQNGFWTQTKADMVGKPFEIPAIEEATPLGAALLAGIGVGLYRNEQEAFERVYRPGRVIEPDLRLTPRYAERFELFRTLHPALQRIHAGLRQPF